MIYLFQEVKTNKGAVKMNDVQKKYMIAKAAYDTAVETEDWDFVEDLCTDYVEAEGDLAEWALSVAEESGLIPEKDLKILKEKWMFPQYSPRLVDLAFRLKV